MKKVLALLVIVLTLTVIAGCSFTLVDLNPGITERGLILTLTDKPGDNDILQVNVAIERVELVPTDGEVIEWKIFETPLAVDILTLRFAEEVIGEGQLPVGSYEQIRLVVQNSATVRVKTDENEEDFALKIPSGSETGLKINHNFNIEDGSVTELLLDVDVREFVNQKGQGDYQMKPTAIRVINKIDSGSVMGQVYGLDGNPITDRDVYVGAYAADGTKVGETLALREDISEGGNIITAGSFVVKGLPEGDYTLGILPNNDGDVTDDQYIDAGTFTIKAGENYNFAEPILIEIPLVNQ